MENIGFGKSLSQPSWILNSKFLFPFRFFYFCGLFEMVMPSLEYSLVHHHTHMFLVNSHLPTLECWDCNYLPYPILVHDTLMMLTNTQMVSLCPHCNHSSDYSQSLDLKIFQGPLLTSHRLDFSFLDDTWKIGITPFLGYTSDLILFTKDCIL
jgi:hypothetical protein